MASLRLITCFFAFIASHVNLFTRLNNSSNLNDKSIVNFSQLATKNLATQFIPVPFLKRNFVKRLETFSKLPRLTLKNMKRRF